MAKKARTSGSTGQAPGPESIQLALSGPGADREAPIRPASVDATPSEANPRAGSRSGTSSKAAPELTPASGKAKASRSRKTGKAGTPAGADPAKPAGLSSEAILGLLKSSPAARTASPFTAGPPAKAPFPKPSGAKAAARAAADAWSRPSTGVPKEPPKRDTGTFNDRQIEGIRALARVLAEVTLEGDDSDPVMICNPITEPAALAASELLYDNCKWCQTDIYYDRMMPSPFGITRVCIQCGILLLEAEKKGSN